MMAVGGGDKIPGVRFPPERWELRKKSKKKMAKGGHPHTPWKKA
jgi:hypothetical protein